MAPDLSSPRPPEEQGAFLRDGTAVILREVKPADKELFRLGLARLSEQTLYFRFLMPRSRLMESELTYLTDVDGRDRYALGVVTRDAEGFEQPVAVGRFDRLPDDPEIGELAILVIDAYQGRGVGGLLFFRLADAMLARGIHTARCDTAIENVKIHRMFQALAPHARPYRHGAVLRYDIPIPCPRGRAPRPPPADD